MEGNPQARSRMVGCVIAVGVVGGGGEYKDTSCKKVTRVLENSRSITRWMRGCKNSGETRRSMPLIFSMLSYRNNLHPDLSKKSI